MAFAPCKKQDRQFLVDLMDAVEDIPGTALVEGIQWEFETFGEYMAMLQAQPRACDVAVMVGHSPVRVWVRAPARSHGVPPHDPARSREF